MGFSDTGFYSRINEEDQKIETGSWSESFSFDFYDIINDYTFESDLSWHGIYNHQFQAGLQFKDVKFDLGMEFQYSSLDTTIYAKPLEMMDSTREISIYLQERLK